MNKHRDIEILECTLRDGSYTIDFQFTNRDTALIATALENAGFKLIEVGHGVGLHASQAGKGEAAATDEEYMKAVAGALKHAQWGMFFIPKIGRHEDLELAARHGMNFVRIGTNATEVKESREYIEHAKKLGMYVSANLMKSYVLPPRELARQAQLSEKYGVDIVVLVDSAGCMLPEDIRLYLGAMQDVLNVPLGLHCHDNLGLGMANVLTAIDCGVRRVDSTLQGMGRGGGNPPTEVLLTVLKKRGIDLGIDINRLMDISERMIKPLLQQKGWDSINITSGYAGFHSSHLKTILKYADLHGVDPRDLIVSVCEKDQVYAPAELVEDLARELNRRRAGRAGLERISLPRFAFPIEKRRKPSAKSLAEASRKVACEVRATAKKRGKHSVFNILSVAQPVGKATVHRFIKEEFDYVIASVEVDNLTQLAEVVEAVDGIVDILFVDSEFKPYLKQPLAEAASSLAKKSRVFSYKDNDVWVESVNRQLGAMLPGIRGCPITICGTDNLALKLVLLLLEQGAEVTLAGDTPAKLSACARSLKLVALGRASLRTVSDPVKAAWGAKALVAFERQRVLISRAMLEVLAADGIVFDAGIGSISAEAVAYGNKRGIPIVRPDMRAALAAELASAMGTGRTVKELMGRSEIAGIPVVSGGMIGRYGEIVVDSISNPSRVVGVADGRGRVLYEAEEFADKIQMVEAEIMRRHVSP